MKIMSEHNKRARVSQYYMHYCVLFASQRKWKRTEMMLRNQDVLTLCIIRYMLRPVARCGSGCLR